MFYNFLKRQYKNGNISEEKLMAYVPKFISGADAEEIKASK
nr:MAG TPA: hypothetical protein [Caudoviricetes sp.]